MRLAEDDLLGLVDDFVQWMAHKFSGVFEKSIEIQLL
jgi:hypothetical protein